MEHLDNGFWLVTRGDLIKLSSQLKDFGGLPKHGYAKHVKLDDGRTGWLQRTWHQSKQVWAVHIYEAP